jgi:hypothetical protein
LPFPVVLFSPKNTDMARVLQLEKRANEVIRFYEGKKHGSGRRTTGSNSRTVQGTSTAKGCRTLCASLVVSFAR